MVSIQVTKCIAAAVLLSLVACSGGSGSSNPANVLGGNQETGISNPSDDIVNSGALPNWVVTDFFGTSVYRDQFNWTATLTNTGSGAGEIPFNGLLMESVTSDFSTGAALSDYSVNRADGVVSRILQPGESAQITGNNTILDYGILQGGFSWTTVYIKFLINPDWGIWKFRPAADNIKLC